MLNKNMGKITYPAKVIAITTCWCEAHLHLIDDKESCCKPSITGSSILGFTTLIKTINSRSVNLHFEGLLYWMSTAFERVKQHVLHVTCTLNIKCWPTVDQIVDSSRTPSLNTTANKMYWWNARRATIRTRSTNSADVPLAWRETGMPTKWWMPRLPDQTRLDSLIEPWERQNRYSKMQGNWWKVFLQKHAQSNRNSLPFLTVFHIGYNLCKTSMPVNVTSSLTTNTNSGKQGLPAPSRTTNVLSPHQ